MKIWRPLLLLVNPLWPFVFQDPAIEQVTHSTKKATTGLEDYAPFGNEPSNLAGPRNAGPAIMHPTTQDVSPSPPQYSRSAQQTTNISVEELEVRTKNMIVVIWVMSV